MTLTHPLVPGKLLIGSDFWQECPKAQRKLMETMEAGDHGSFHQMHPGGRGSQWSLGRCLEVNRDR